MAWVKLDDHFDEHPKLARIGPLGMALQVAALCYCNRNLTDGFVPRSVAVRLLSWETPDATGQPMKLSATWDGEIFGGGWDIEATEIVAMMVGVGVWTEVPGGYSIHDFHDYQPAKADVLAERAKTAERVRKHREKVSNAKGNGDGNAVSNTAPVPGPVPVPEPQNQELKTVASQTSRRGDEAIRISDDQVYLAEEINEKWEPKQGAITPAAVVKLNKQWGMSAVTSAMRIIHGFPPENGVKTPVAYLVGILQNGEAMSA